MLIVKSKVKKLALNIASVSRSHRFTQVSKSFLDDVEARTKQAIQQLVSAHPSKGKTLKGYKS